MKSQPIAVDLSDVHIKLSNISVVKALFRQAADLCIRLGVRVIVFRGDMFVEREKQPLECLDAVRVIIQDLESDGLVVFAIHGNHDQTDQDSTLSYLSLYDQYKNFYLVSDHRSVEITKGLIYHFVPYFKTNDVYRSHLGAVKESIQPDKINILFTHKEFNGVKNNDGSIVLDGISPEEVKEFTKVYVGHYHDESVVGENIYYLGATLQHNYGEHYEKGLVVHYSDGKWKRIKTDFPVFRKIKIMVDDTDQAIEQINGVLDTIQEDELVRMIFIGSREKIEALPVSDLKDAGIDVKFERSDILSTNTEDVNECNIITFNKQSLMKAWLEYSSLKKFTTAQRTQGLLFLKEQKDVVTN